MNGDARQRWRVVFRRGAEAAELGGRDVQATIEANLAAACVPLAGRTQMAVGLPTGLAAEHELLDVTLTERWPISRARQVLGTALPAGHELVGCHDVWLGEPALAAQVRGADYRVVIEADGANASDVRAAATALLSSDRIERTRRKGDRAVAYDLRPLIDAIELASEGPPIVLGIRVRIDSERGAGRPDEVLAALEAHCPDAHLRITELTRVRLALAGDAAP